MKARIKEIAIEDKPSCFGEFYSFGALDCTTDCVYTEDCKKQKPDPKQLRTGNCCIGVVSQE